MSLKTVSVAPGGGGNGSGTVTEVDTGTGLSGGPITSSGTIKLANTAVTAGTYGNASAVPQIVVNAQGQITSASNVTISSGGSGTVTNVATGTGLTGGPITTIGTIALANTAVTAGTYGNASAVGVFTVNAQGQLTAASNTGITIAVANVTGAVPNTVNVLAGNGMMGGGALTGNVTLSLPTTGVTAATYGNSTYVSQVTIDVYGRVTSASNVAIATGGSGTVTNVATGTGLTGGPITSTGTIAIANTAVTAATYGNATAVGTFTVNAQGQLTAASNVSILIGNSGLVNNTITLGNTTLTLGGTTTSVGNLTLANATLTNVTVSSVITPITPAEGGTGLSTLTANNVLLGNGTGNVTLVAFGTSGNVLYSNGTTWISSTGSHTLGNTTIALGSTVTSVGNLTLANATLTNVTISSVINAITPAEGGTGLSTLTANNVILGNGTGNVTLVAYGTSGNVLYSNGTTWISSTGSHTLGNTSISLGSTVTSVGNLTLANATLTNATISSVINPITAAEGGTGLATLTANSVLLGNGTNTIQLIAPGTSGNVLTSNGTTWLSQASSGGGGLVKISTLNPNNVASIAWTSLGTYHSYLLVFVNLAFATSDGPSIVVGEGAGPTYITSNYYAGGNYQTGSSGPTSFYNSSASDLFQNQVSTSTSEGWGGYAYITGMLSGDTVQFNALLQCQSGVNYRYQQTSSVLHGDTTAKTAIKITGNAGANLVSGFVTLYGLS